MPLPSTMPVPSTAEQFRSAGFDVVETTETVSARKRSAANDEKIALMKDLLDILDENDNEIDLMFRTMFGLAAEFGYKFTAPAENLLIAIEAKHRPTRKRR